MDKVFTNNDLHEAWGCPLDTIKRWSREFLAADPDAGHQGGRARKYTHSDAFTLFLAGNLIRNWNHSIPETKSILEEMIKWLKDKDYLPFKIDGPNLLNLSTYHLNVDGISYGEWEFIIEKTNAGFFYSVLGYQGLTASYQKPTERIIDGRVFVLFEKVKTIKEIISDSFPTTLGPRTILSIDALITDFRASLLTSYKPFK